MLFGLGFKVSEVLYLIKDSADKQKGSITASQTDMIKNLTPGVFYFERLPDAPCVLFRGRKDGSRGDSRDRVWRRPENVEN